MMQEIMNAIREARLTQTCATFEDGLKCQQVMDAVRVSTAERRWINLT